MRKAVEGRMGDGFSSAGYPSTRVSISQQQHPLHDLFAKTSSLVSRTLPVVLPFNEVSTTALDMFTKDKESQITAAKKLTDKSRWLRPEVLRASVAEGALVEVRASTEKVDAGWAALECRVEAIDKSMDGQEGDLLLTRKSRCTHVLGDFYEARQAIRELESGLESVKSWIRDLDQILASVKNRVVSLEN
ncbi:hypothetical protein ISF_09038 [Cordyceps fumosorosea ARSEF 2679]|uniref:Uncharacterized protein n=1 Tax=Cordyceps fumosorosea (strain ARSEF 2679) TaxID=1081104 RepID=A0A167LH41_CORFA|nr:hypothetical protein ISF_09038 [Cordyceps fumosorosea ARSEF 2679]OAA53084.1 hypothetical protein ISF_09038 [Cordyceps fumosorosea ARSEF 2679]